MKKLSFVIMILMINACAKNGSDGSAGTNGTNGTNGTTNKVVQSMGCASTVAGLTGAAGTALNGLSVQYLVTVTASGDVNVMANVASTTLQATGVMFYGSSQNGAISGSVNITDDFATPSSGFWTVTGNRTAGTFTAVYTDSSLGGQSPVTLNSNTAACLLQNFN